MQLGAAPIDTAPKAAAHAEEMADESAPF